MHFPLILTFATQAVVTNYSKRFQEKLSRTVSSALGEASFFGLCLFRTKEVCQRFSAIAVPEINTILLILFFFKCDYTILFQGNR